MDTSTPISLAALSVVISDAGLSGSAIQLLPPGPTFRADDGSGRPADAPAWRIDAASAAALIKRFSSRANPRVIDYEHQTLATPAAIAPAAGWFDGIEWRDGEGLFATGVKWTPKAEAMLKAGEYRFISPVFSYAPGSGEVLEIKMAALTNNPGLDGMKAAALTATAAHLFNQKEVLEVELKTLLAAVGLPETETEEAALTAVAALKAKADGIEAKDAEIAALKSAAPATAYDPVKHVAIEVVTSLQEEIAALKAEAAVVSADALIEAARNEGKAIPDALAAHLKTMPIAAMKGALAAMPATAALKSMQSSGRKEDPSSPSAADLAVMKALGISSEQFAKGKEHSNG